MCLSSSIVAVVRVRSRSLVFIVDLLPVSSVLFPRTLFKPANEQTRLRRHFIGFKLTRSLYSTFTGGPLIWVVMLMCILYGIYDRPIGQLEAYYAVSVHAATVLIVGRACVMHERLVKY